MKQLYNDPRNHVKRDDYVKAIVGKETGESINEVADATTEEVLQALMSSSAELSPLKNERDGTIKEQRNSIED